MIEERIEELETKMSKVVLILEELKKHLIPEKQDTTELSKRVVEELKTGDEPRHYKKCRKCGKKPCICEEPTE